MVFRRVGPSVMRRLAKVLDQGPESEPYEIHRQFPARWQAYIVANYRDLQHVQQAFHVSERAARKWWNGDTGCVGGHVAVAVIEHPVEAPRMLFGGFAKLQSGESSR